MLLDLEALLDLLLVALKLAGPAQQNAGPSLAGIVLLSSSGQRPLNEPPAPLRQLPALCLVLAVIFPCLVAEPSEPPEDLVGRQCHSY